MRNARMISNLVLAGLALFSIAAMWTRTRVVDIDGDGFKEAEIFYAGSQIVKTLVDVDHDGFKETVIFYKDGHRDRAEQDANNDGKVDRWIWYYFTGVARKIGEDFNFDGKADYWLYLRDGRVYRWEEDRNADGEPDLRTTYLLDKNGKTQLLQQSLDEDFDGNFESLSGITAAKKEAMLPHSLAEALLR
jgi:hypothetical protein